MEVIKDTSLDEVKSKILTSTDLCRDLPACVTLIKEFVKTIENIKGNVQIAAVGDCGGGGYRNVNLSTEDRWYKVQEWKDHEKRSCFRDKYLCRN